MSEIIFHVRCHCTAVQLSFQVSPSDLPLPSHTCLCSTCRHSSGTLATFLAHIPSGTTPDPRKADGLACYRADPDSPLLRFFCSTCGTHMACVVEGQEIFYVSTSCTQEAQPSTFSFEDAMFVSSSIDGGLSEWLPKMKRWATYPGIGDDLAGREEPAMKSTQHSEREGMLQAHCDCRGVSFKICRPDWNSEHFRRDFPDLVLPSEDRTSRNIAKERNNDQWWVASDRAKYTANACLCTSDRLSTGSELHQWGFVPTAFITLDDGSALTRSFGTLKEYESSPGTFRRFCGVCGALVFWHHISDRPNMIDVAVGILDAGSGARAEDWLEWRTTGPSYAEDATNSSLAEPLTKGYQTWAQRQL